MPERKYEQVSTVLQTVLETVSRESERETGFVQRASKVNGERFAQMLVLGCLEEADVSLTDLVAVGEAVGVSVSASGLNQRIDDEAVVLMQRLLQAALRHTQGDLGESPAAGLLAAFGAVYLEDSTYLSLPAALAGRYRGSGGNASRAGVKVYLNYEYRSGTLHTVTLFDGCCPDQAIPLSPVPPAAQGAGCLRLFDLGFFKLTRLAQLMAQGECFICRHHFQTTLYTHTGERLDLEALLAALPPTQTELDLVVLLGAHERLPVRLLLQRVPAAVVAQRRQRIIKDARRMRRKVSPRKLRLAAWNLFCTNVPAKLWNVAQVLTIYRLRWQVELLFKLWKSDLGLDQLGDWRPARLLCQLYARLTALVLLHFLFRPIRFAASGELSLPKALSFLRHMLPLFAEAMAAGWQRLATLIHCLLLRCLRHALKDKRRKKPSTFALLSAIAP